MKIPLRQQISEYDCVPTTFLNAISYLYDRNEIPPQVIQRIYLYCLDEISVRSQAPKIGHGTTRLAIQLLSQWINYFTYEKFQTNTEFLEGDDVHFSTGSKLIKHLNDKGVLMLRVKASRTKNIWHYILVLEMKGDWIYCYDSYSKSLKANSPGNYEYLQYAEDNQANLRVSKKWIDKKSNQNNFKLGSSSERECLLINRLSN